MRTASKRFCIVFIFVLMAFIAANISYYRVYENYRLGGLKQAKEIIQIDSLHSLIPENDFKRDSLLAWLPKFKDKKLLNWIIAHPNCKISSAFDSDKSGNWVWAYVINDKDIVVLATIGNYSGIVTSL